MPFQSERSDGRWFIRNGPILFGPYETGEKAQDAALVLNQRDPHGGGSPPDALIKGVSGLGLDPMQKAECLLRSGHTDEEVERLTGVSVFDILSLRAKRATGGKPKGGARWALQRDGVPERRW